MTSRQLTDLVNDRRSRIEESDLVPIWLPDFTDDFFGRIYSRIVRIVSRRVVSDGRGFLYNKGAIVSEALVPFGQARDGAFVFCIDATLPLAPVARFRRENA
jgi:hypothetical protein